MKFADLLIQKSFYSEAKYEIELAIKSREQEGWKLTENQLQYQSAQWYQSTMASKNNQDFYKKYIIIAETLLFIYLRGNRLPVKNDDKNNIIMAI
jgi:hypothetical protein